MKRRLTLAFLAGLAVFLASCMSVSQPSQRVLLGERMVAFKADHDVIEVGRYEGTFHSLVIFVEKNDVELFNLVVVYGNGERERFDTRLVFNEGSRSRALQFAGGQRRIRDIEFTYRTMGTWMEGRAHVLVYGVR